MSRRLKVRHRRVAELFDSEREGLERTAVEQSTVLTERRRQLEEFETSSAANGQMPLGEAEEPDPATRVAADTARLAAEIEQEALRLFFDRHMVAVAVAGRIDIQADSSGGPILAGDLIQPGPTPGVARRAIEAGPVLGVALADLDPVSGTVPMLIARSWWPGAAGSQLASAGQVDRAARAPELARLSARVVELEKMLAELMATSTVRAASSSAP